MGFEWTEIFQKFQELGEINCRTSFIHTLSCQKKARRRKKSVEKCTHYHFLFCLLNQASIGANIEADFSFRVSLATCCKVLYSTLSSLVFQSLLANAVVSWHIWTAISCDFCFVDHRKGLWCFSFFH